MPTPEPEHVTDISPEAVAEAWVKLGQRLEPVLDQYRDMMLRLSDVLRQEVIPTLQAAYQRLDPRVQARLRQGHPAYPQRQVIHKGGKP